jgi:hypothetical protein
MWQSIVAKPNPATGALSDVFCHKKGTSTTLFLRKGSAILFVDANRGHFYSRFVDIKQDFAPGSENSLDLGNTQNYDM